MPIKFKEKFLKDGWREIEDSKESKFFVNAFLGQEMELKRGQEMRIEVDGGMERGGYDFQIKFLTVTQDYRCPNRMQCVEPGIAEVVLDISRSTDLHCIGKQHTLYAYGKLSNRENHKVEYANCQIELIALKPYSETEFFRDIHKIDYTSLIKVEKSGFENLEKR